MKSLTLLSLTTILLLPGCVTPPPVTPPPVVIERNYHHYNRYPERSTKSSPSVNSDSSSQFRAVEKAD